MKRKGDADGVANVNERNADEDEGKGEATWQMPIAVLDLWDLFLVEHHSCGPRMDTVLHFFAVDSNDTRFMVSIGYAVANKGRLGGLARERGYNIYMERSTGRNGYPCRVSTKRDMLVMSVVMVMVVQGRA